MSLERDGVVPPWTTSPAPLALAADSRVPSLVVGAATADYERYFRIVRGAPDLVSWTRDVLRLQSAVLADLPATGLDAPQRADVLTGLLHASHVTLTAWLRTRSLPDEPPAGATAGATAAGAAAGAGTPTGGPVGDDHGDALRRWKLGHQLFHLLLAAMNSVLDDTLTQVRGAHWASVCRDLERLRALYDAATAAMAYASDFPASVYRDDVRPTMEPPFLAPGFSGVLNREHQVMAERMRALRDALGELPRTVPVAALRRAEALLRAAQRRNRRAHAAICERCVPGGASLLQQHRAGTGERPWES
ncbi:hypothetical protein [Streptomyces sp. ISL-11]|uniref:hypothetical protein n=1 Tax=Streptomyces sp. ISL-11 TaxID=2819174 RepID=UPI001BEB2D0F|nr:hypothetical protein [Streptomyces sp. ISL-11]MBT2386532.1 hypothetical protein [Streptomyces sp. ISL-11]